MKLIACLLFLVIFSSTTNAQIITANSPARLMVYAMKPDGTQAVMSTESLSIVYDQLQMTGEILLHNLQTDDGLLKNLLDSAREDRITFSGLIPDGQFVFHSTLNSKFVVETELNYGEFQSRILIDYDISNRKTSVANSFDITCSGNISLRDNLGMTRDLGLDDHISFQFFQNVQTKTY